MAEPYLEDADLTLYQGDALEVLKTLPDGSVHMCVTSPPFYGLRDYQCEGQIGLEETPEQWVEKLVGVFREVKRVLRNDGTIWVECGDSFLPGKQLGGMPWRLAFALQADGWILRSDIIFSRPNPMPESVTDRPTKSHSYVFLLSKSARYFFDQEAVREQADWAHWGKQTNPKGNPEGGENGSRDWIVHRDRGEMADRYPGRNVRSVWQIATQPYPEAHFATYPEELVRRCVLAGTSERGCCPECGAPWERLTDTSYEKSPVHGAGSVVGRHYETGSNNFDGAGMPRLNKVTSTLGWGATCSCDLPIEVAKPCTVLDPFFGSGTTGLVARKHGRRTIGIELSEDYCRLAARRLQQLSLLA